MNPVANSLGEKNRGDDGWTVNGILNSPGWIKAMTWYQNLYKDGLALRGFTANEVANLFRAGKVLFMVGGTWNAPDQVNPGSAVHLDFDCGYAPVPAVKGYENKVGTGTGSWHFGINHISPKQNYVVDFIKWMSFGEGNKAYIVQHGQVPSSVELVNEIEKNPAESPIQKIAAFEALNTAVPRAITPGYPEYNIIMDNAWEDVRNGSDVKTTLDRAVRDIETAFAKYR
jgi:ABC-type glycerol-3-phosphate transport system substrate-binding protein